MAAHGHDILTLTAILGGLPDPVLAIDSGGGTVFANPPAATLLGERPSLSGELVFLCDQVRRTGQADTLFIDRGDGIGLECRARPVDSLVVVSMREAVADLRAELAAAHNDNRALLQEVHHRVKNSLQVVSAMLRMQSWRLADSPTRQPFEEACGRILALATVYEALYRQGSPGAVDFAAILVPLVDDLARQRADNRSLPPVDIVGGNLLLTIDKAIPAALIVQEWLSAASGPVTIGLAPGGPIALTGLAAIDQATLGSRMVAVLVAQLQGRVEAFSGPPAGLILHLKRDDLGTMAGGDQKPAEIGAGDGGGHVVA